jgi:hypothetical protein
VQEADHYDRDQPGKRPEGVDRPGAEQADVEEAADDRPAPASRR